MCGVWWSGAEPDVEPAGDGAIGYSAVTLQHGAGLYPVHEDVKKHLYDAGKGSTKWEDVGEVLYNRGLVNAMLGSEAIRTAMATFGNKPLTGQQVRWGLENLNVTAETRTERGFRSMLRQPHNTSPHH